MTTGPEEGQGDDTHSTAKTKPPTPLPYKKLGAVLIVLMNESISASMLFPIIGFYVAHLSHATNDEAGYESGILVAMFMYGQFLCGKVWGRISDVSGRRPVLLGGLVLSMVIMFLFGWSTNIYMAMFLRFCHGLANGNIGVAKVYVMEITDKTNESKGMAAVALAWNVGCIIGPFLGGVLYDPATTGIFGTTGPDSFFYGYPAALPCIVISTYTAIATLISYHVLNETCEQAQPFTLLGFISTAVEQFKLTYLPASLHGGSSTSSNTTVVVQAEPEASRKDTNEIEGGEEDSSNEQQEQEGKEKMTEGAADAKGGLTYRGVLVDPKLRIPVILYIIMSAADFGCFEVTPLWLMASRGSGGLGMNPAQIGYVILGTGLVGMMGTFVYSPAIERFPSRLMFWQWCCLMWAVMVAFTPFTTICLPFKLAVPMVVLLTVTRAFFQTWIFTTVFLFIRVVTPREHLGTMNGIAQSCGSLLRATMPVVLTPIFALSLEYKYPPFVDHYTAFFVISGTLVYCYWWSLGAKGLDRVKETAAQSSSED